MSYLKFIDNLSKSLKIVIAIFLPVLFVAYRFVKDIIEERWLYVLLDVLICIAVPFCFWIVNLIWIIQYNQVFDLYELDKISKEEKKKSKKNEYSIYKDKAIEVEVVDKK